ncbi:sugar porter family MFS transporter [Lichenihabitans sp. PAMC28606]|uniref:sugar porter family MFS transporter n=1 Tax=Lichenihabitans sp. PAMC28606 TaxID=2880932 RepID=UPI001D0BC502|nr:sugar porter family MFS transporter [Lichenihabitans sp. PAMC28606]UDL94664.1 sugar porter family MFS transporter [Lichenihabitans sp. PAMC28606]
MAAAALDRLSFYGRASSMHYVFIAGVAALGGLLFGYDTGVISGALLYIRDLFALSPAMQGLVAAIALAGAAAGAGFAGSLSDRFGRRTVILFTALIFIAGSLISAAATTLTVLLIGRVVVGVAIGVSSMLTPLYLSEMAPAKNRGVIVSLNQLFLTVGIFVSYLVGYGLSGVHEGWRWMLGLGAVPGAILFVGMLLLPESPRWLAGHGRMKDAEGALRRVRGNGVDLTGELTSLRKDLRRDDGKSHAWGELLKPALRNSMIVGIGLAIFQQITGVNTVIYFAPTIFQTAGLSSASAAILATAGVGLVNVLFTLVSMRLVDGLGRRPLLIWSLCGMAASLCLLAFAFAFGANASVGWLTITALCLYVGFFAVGLGPVFWLLISEIFPLRLRGRAMGIATVAQWILNLIVTATFLNLVQALGSSGVFLIYAALTVLAVLFTLRFVPETKGRSLEQIEADMSGDASVPHGAIVGR